MVIRRQPSVVFLKLPPGSIFHIDFEVGAHAGPVQAELYEINLATPGVVSQHSRLDQD